jgi:hypothetical protein
MQVLDTIATTLRFIVLIGAGPALTRVACSPDSRST